MKFKENLLLDNQTIHPSASENISDDELRAKKEADRLEALKSFDLDPEPKHPSFLADRIMTVIVGSICLIIIIILSILRVYYSWERFVNI